jgi:hypothetical protein
MHDELAAAGVEVGPIEHPFYMPAGEFRTADPDGYVLLIGQLDAPARLTAAGPRLHFSAGHGRRTHSSGGAGARGERGSRESRRCAGAG